MIFGKNYRDANRTVFFFFLISEPSVVHKQIFLFSILNKNGLFGLLLVFDKSSVMCYKELAILVGLYQV